MFLRVTSSRWSTSHWTALEARAALTRDLRREVEAATRRGVVEPKLRQRIKDRAAKDGMTEAAAATALWNEIRIRHHFASLTVDTNYLTFQVC